MLIGVLAAFGTCCWVVILFGVAFLDICVRVIGVGIRKRKSVVHYAGMFSYNPEVGFLVFYCILESQNFYKTPVGSALPLHHSPPFQHVRFPPAKIQKITLSPGLSATSSQNLWKPSLYGWWSVVSYLDRWGWSILVKGRIGRILLWRCIADIATWITAESVNPGSEGGSAYGAVWGGGNG